MIPRTSLFSTPRLCTHNSLCIRGLPPDPWFFQYRHRKHPLPSWSGVVITSSKLSSPFTWTTLKTRFPGACLYIFNTMKALHIFRNLSNFWNHGMALMQKFMELGKFLSAFGRVSSGLIYKIYLYPLNIDIPTSGIINNSTGKRNMILKEKKMTLRCNFGGVW